MNLTQIDLNDLFTVTVIVAQAGIVYYRLKKVEEKTQELNHLLIEFAIYKTSLKHYRDQYEKQSSRIEFLVQKLHDRISNIEAKVFDAFKTS